ncbi:DUF6262 family protein [Leptothoe spongobia]|uniref:Transposase n=1 Tax=Leptothoe spongobia TAU-MAC 1115 TaxID=1967444 RepID=A0A947DC18_9CYAN|nr:DUF6262 family protein [Leptothoe spongobia]MBT9314133.1 hypothetical protein [Leptothoe spongobia TAU-MAC 1115]
MKVKRNADGLRRNAEKKRQETFEKVDKAIRKLVKEKKAITFNAVAEAASVSKAWLYKEPDVKERISQLRDQSSVKGKTPRAVSASEASLRKLTVTLKARIKRLEAENIDLRRQNEVFGSYVLKNRELSSKILELERYTQKLKTNTHLGEENLDTSNELKALGVKLNSTLIKLIASTPSGILETATQALKQAQKTGAIHNPGGFLYKAITDCWRPNEAIKGNQDMGEFNQWWSWAYSEGIAIASQQTEQGLMILDTKEEWISFSEIIKRHPLPTKH